MIQYTAKLRINRWCVLLSQPIGTHAYFRNEGIEVW